jgi:uncharacterized protein (TIGR02453 family)
MAERMLRAFALRPSQAKPAPPRIRPRAARLIVELAHRQDRLWYAGHKPEIDEHVYAPLRALLEEARSRLSRSYPRRQITTKIFRIHRDVRFSKDKSPFKDHASGVLMVGSNVDPGTAIGALYLQIGPEEGAAAGHWAMAPDQLARYRGAVQNERHGATLSKLLRPLVAGGYQIISAAQLSRAPKGVDPSHPRAELLRHKGLALDFPAIPAKVRHTEALLDWCVERSQEVAPLVRWLLEHVAD